MQHLILEVLTPTGEIYSGECRHITLPGIDGIFEVLPKHMNLVSQLVAGKIYLTELHGKKLEFEINAGFAEVQNYKCTVLINES
jgi:F-type H+-transporting ATPase subunit epsilon